MFISFRGGGGGDEWEPAGNLSSADGGGLEHCPGVFVHCRSRLFIIIKVHCRILLPKLLTATGGHAAPYSRWRTVPAFVLPCSFLLQIVGPCIH